jgi:shikimate kinase
MKNLVFLMGMPGCGKSTFGSKLAKKLNFNFFDLDDFIEKKENKSIFSIFNDEGEIYFRKIETTYLNEIISQNLQAVISLGGGTPCFNNNLENINKNGISIYFEAPLKLLSDRIIAAKQIRPMFKGLNQEEVIQKLNDLIEKRKLFYELATFKINVLELNIELIINQLKSY